MNIGEVTRICRAVAALAPAQKMDEDTPTVWLAVLAPLRFVDARQAVVTLGGRQQWISAADITTEVKRLRRKRLEGIELLGHLADTPEQWRELIRKVADGEVEIPALDAGPSDPEVPAPAAIKAMVKAISDLKQLQIETSPPDIAATVSTASAEAMESERSRQIAALAALDADE